MAGPNRTISTQFDKMRQEAYESFEPHPDDTVYKDHIDHINREYEQRAPGYPKDDSKLSTTEKHKYKELVQKLKNHEKHSAIRAYNELEKAFQQKRISQEMLKACLYAKQAKMDQADRKAQFLREADKFAKRAEENKGGETPIDRMVHLAKFNPESLAFMMLFDDIYFVINLMFAFAGVPLVREMAQFEKIKNQNPDSVFDPGDEKWEYPPLGSPAKNGISSLERRKMTENNMRKLGLYNYEFDQNGRFSLIGQPILDPSQVSYDICLANGIIHKPTTMVCVRKTAIEFSVKMIGSASDPLHWIQKQMEGLNSPKGPSGSKGFDDAEASALASVARPVPQ